MKLTSILVATFAVVCALAAPISAQAKDNHDHGDHHGDHHNDHHDSWNHHGSYYYGPNVYFHTSPYYYDYGYGGYGGPGYYSPYYYGGPRVGISFYGGSPYVYRGREVYGSYSDSLGADVQRELRHRGYYRGPIDGDIGPGSRAAIRAYQSDRGLSATGRIDRSLLRSLGIG